jgi:hypothetical protein
VPSNGGPNLAKTMRTNAAKVGGTTVESPNAYRPGDGSVAEMSAEYHRAMLEGRIKHDASLLYDHREAPGDTDLDDRDSAGEGAAVRLRRQLGPSGRLHDPPDAVPAGTRDLESIITLIRDPNQDVEQTMSDFLNQITAAADAWLSQPDWAAAKADEDTDPIGDRDVVVLGFDGSRGRAKGKPDASALVGCRVRDGLVFQVGVWEARTDRRSGRTGPPLVEIEAAIADCVSSGTGWSGSSPTRAVTGAPT